MLHRVLLDLSLQFFYLGFKLLRIQGTHLTVVLEGLVLFPQQPDRIFELLRVAVPVFEVLHVLQSGQVEVRDAHFGHIFLRASILKVFIVVTKLHFHVAL